MTGDIWRIALLLLAAMALGGAIGIERTLHGHAAGFRTHALVCLTSCALMLLAVYPSAWIDAPVADALGVNISRVIQGVMTGIGFLGAGVIMKQGLEVRGLTTAAAIWSAAAIGIMIGVGSFWVALATTLFTLIVLTVFRKLEGRLPIELIVHATVQCARDDLIEQEDLVALVRGFALSVEELTYGLDASQLFAYRLVMSTRSRSAMNRLAGALRTHAKVQQFDIALRRD
jgi:putative Mg2+ transporter-C (MgtC) family protein